MSQSVNLATLYKLGQKNKSSWPLYLFFNFFLRGNAVKKILDSELKYIIAAVFDTEVM